MNFLSRRNLLFFPGRTLLTCLLLVLALLLTSTAAPLAREIPDFNGYVNDQAAMISPAARARLEKTLLDFDRSDSTQVAILTIDSLEGDALEDFSIRVVDQWKVGQKNKDNGILLLAVLKERKLRIEVGRGLEGVLTDLLTGRIIDQVITPRFKTGNIDEGFEAGTAAIIQATRGEFKAEPADGSGRQGESLFTYLIFAVILVSFLGNLNKILGAVAGGILLPLLFFIGLSSPLGLLGLLLLIPLGAVGGLLLPILFASSMHNRGRGGHYGGGFGGGGFSGGGSFGGFGGGGFGGGGASGGW